MIALRRPDLESFDDPNAPAAPVPSKAYRDGFAAGQADATAGVTARLAAETSTLREAIDDAQFTYQDARRALLNDIGPIIAAMCDRLLPAAATVAFVPLVMDEISRLTTDGPDGGLQLRANPQHMDALQIATAGLPITLTPDASLTAGQAICAPRVQPDTLIDVDRLVHQLRDIIGALATDDRQISRKGT